MNNKPVNENLAVTSGIDSLPFILKLPLLGDRPCLDFINTLDWRLRPEKRQDSLITYSDLLAFALRTNLISSAHYSSLYDRALENPSAAERTIIDARAFRDALTSFVDEITAQQDHPETAQVSAECLAIIDAARRKAHESESLTWLKGHLQLFIKPEDEGLDFPWLALVRDAEDLLYSSLASKVRICAAEGCGWAFIDLSKNGKRRWCSMQLCGNREKAARFKAKKNELSTVPRGTKA
jgi:predicted RNA-binding Zn ribbon-like protein